MTGAIPDGARRSETSLWAAATAPWCAPWNLASCVKRLVSCSPAAFGTSLATAGLVHGLAAAFMLLSIEMFQSDGVVRSPLFAWRDLNRGATFGPVESAFAVGLAVPAAMAAVLGLLFFPRTMRDETLWRAWMRMFRAQTVACGVTAVLLLVVGTFCVLAERRSNHPMFALLKQVAPLQPLAAFSVLASIRLVVAFAERIAEKTADLAPAPQLPPVCEWCGYDLSHTDPAGVCTECGRPIAQSLGVDAQRAGCRWENNGTFRDWLVSSWHVLTAPRAFYASLKTRGSLEPALSYAQRHLRLIGVGAATWIVLMWIRFGPAFGIVRRLPEATAVVLLVLLVLAALVGGTSFVRVQPVRLRQRGFLLLPLLAAYAFWLTGDSLTTDLEEVIGGSILLFMIAPLACWVGYRVGGAFMAGIAVWNRSLPDMRLAEKVILYEAAFLWIYCIAWGLLVSSFMVFDSWLSRYPATAWIGRPLGMPAEPSAILYATAALSVVWAYRYWVAFRAVRWSNF